MAERVTVTLPAHQWEAILRGLASSGWDSMHAILTAELAKPQPAEDLERERDALAAEVDRLQLVHAGQARLALSAIFLADVDDDEGTQAFVDEWKRHHAAQALRDAAERWDWTEVPGGAPPVDRWLRAEADRLAPKAPDHNEQE